MRWALITDGHVHEITDIDPKGRFHADLQWVKAPEDVQEGWAYDGKSFSAPGVPPLDKTTVLANIDADAERARLKYITPGAGQALTYQEKAAELARYDEDTQPRLAEYPLLAAEIGITADSLKGVADAVRSALAAWRQAGAAIERVRLQAKADVEKARDDAAVQAVIDAIEWP